jgi:hypothetical protein
VTLEEVASMGSVKRMIFDAKGMTEDAHKLLAEAKLERAQVSNAVELSDQMQAAKQQIVKNVTTRRQTDAMKQEVDQAAKRAERGQALYDRPEHVYRVPEGVGRVAQVARAVAPNSLQGMQVAEVERMTAKALDVAWKNPQHQNEFHQRVSRFVLPADERRKQQEKEQAQKLERGNGMERG